MKTHRLIAMASLLLLGGCSYTYRLAAVMIDGRLAFIVDRSSQQQPDCINRISVTLDPKERGNGASDPFLWSAGAGHGCANPFPVFYGQPVMGEPDPIEVSNIVPSKSLEPGVTYEVTAISKGSGYGRARFRLAANGQVDNLP